MRLWASKKPDGTWFSEDEIMMMGGWNSREAFYRYFNRSIALQVRLKSAEFVAEIDKLSVEFQKVRAA